MGPSVTVEWPSMRYQVAHFMALWADQEILQHYWVDRPGDESILDLYSHLGYLMDQFDIMPEYEFDDLGSIIATPREVDRLAKVSAPLETLLAQEWFDWNDAATFLDSGQWTEVSRRAADFLQLLVLNGGCWDHSTPVREQSHLVSDFRSRSRLAVAVASVAEGTPNQAVGATPPPLWMPAAEAASQILEITDPRARSLSSVLVDKHSETGRMNKLRHALEAPDVELSSLAPFARRSLAAMVVNHGGWEWDRL